MSDTAEPQEAANDNGWRGVASARYGSLRRFGTN